MKGFQSIFLLVLIIPFVEMYLLITVGGLIGALPTILLVVFTAVVGAWLLKQQGLATWQRLQTSLAQGQIPAKEMVEGPIILVGGALLLTPGFITDMLGFACLLPQIRHKIAQYVINNHKVKMTGFSTGNPVRDPDALDGEFRREDK
jgi:UPF0716 protein FxsA